VSSSFSLLSGLLVNFPFVGDVATQLQFVSEVQVKEAPQPWQQAIFF
jgi:hypothetical protein